MKKSLLLVTLIILLIPFALHAEEQCSTDAKHTWLMENDPTYRDAFTANQQSIKKYLRMRRPYAEDTVYKIPVVVHVIHQGEAIGTGTNISDSQIISAITALNEDYRKIAGSNGDGSGVDTSIEFCLAKRDPSDQESSGINRIDGTATITDYATNGITGFESSGNEETVKALSKWPNTDYYNIWIVNKIEGNDQAGTQGYAYFPGAGASLDGAVILHNAFGTTGGNLKSFTNRNRTATHELGHAFNLYHTFEGNSCSDVEVNEFSIQHGCDETGDLCCDTPPTTLQTDCNSPACSSTQQVENYMDYTGQECKDTFTSCQKGRMRAAIDTSRASLLTSDGCLPVTAPVSDFSAPTPTCSGDIQFADHSTNGPDTWAWSFPGGTPDTSTDQNPVINYPAGTYDVTLTSSNQIAQGTTETKTDYLKVFDNPPSTCSVLTTDTNTGIGIYNVTLGDINNSSQGAVDENGTQDLTCSQVTTLTPGQSYPISITTGSTNKENVRVYIDYDNDGTFRLQDELAFASSDTLESHTGTVTIPGGVLTNSLTRMRVISDFFNTTSACSDPEYGQAEDYGVIFQATDVPVSNFIVATNPTCVGSVQYFNQSTNGSSGWNWSFPSGTPSTSTEINPQITYTIPALYSATLTATNEIGAGNTETKNNFLGIYNIKTSSCASPPTTINLVHPNPNTYYNSGIINFTLNTINSSSGNALEDHQAHGSEGYMDFSCSRTTLLSPGTDYPVTITGGPSNDARAYIYIDYNNDGDFNDTGELVFSSTDSSGIHSGSFTTASNPVKNIMLRMRVATSLNSLTDACSQSDYGQVEDYGVVFPDNFATLAIGPPSATIAGPGPVSYTVTYADAANISLSNNDISLISSGDANGTVSLSGSGNTRTVTVSSLTGNGTLAIAIANGTAEDTASNPAIGKISTPFTVDTTQPVVSITTPADGLITTSLDPILYYTISEANSGTTTVTVNGDTISHTPGAPLSLNDGTSVIVVSHTDAAGNVGSDTLTIHANRGDINLDGQLSLADVVLGLKLLATSSDTGNNEIVYAETDLNGDDRIGLHEIIFILRRLAGLL